VLMIVMYLTPILYPRTLVPETVRPWIAANPFAWLVDRLREVLLDGRLTPTWNDAAAAVTAVLLLLGGRWLFRRLSPHFEDFI
jgi:lipopolysaccharide transport system permease protein